MTIIKGEAIGGYWIRNELISGNRADGNFFKPYAIVSSWKWRTFPELNNKRLFKGESISQLIEHNSLAPLYRPTADIELSDAVAHCYFSPKKSDSKLTPHNFLNEKDPMSADVIYCALCFLEQLKEYGHTWFKREWQIYDTTVCNIHHCSLRPPKCPVCKPISARSMIVFALLGKCGSCGTNLWQPIKHDAISIASPISLWLLRVLHERLPCFSQELTDFLLDEAFMLTGGEEDSSDLIKEYHFKDLYDDRNFPQTRKKYFLKRKKPTKINLENNVMLHFWHIIMAAFNTFDNFLRFLEKVSLPAFKLESEFFPNNLQYSTVLELKECYK